LKDLCFNSTRSQSWITLGKIKSDEYYNYIDTHINPKSLCYASGLSPEDQSKKDKAITSFNAAMRCFQKAAKSSPNDEYRSWKYAGQLLYSKAKYLCNSPEEACDILFTALHYFEKALQHTDEITWTTLFMAGKVCEKTSRDPKEFLHYYAKATELAEAKNKKIKQEKRKNIEPFYRLHASRLKLAQSKDVNIELLKEHNFTPGAEDPINDAKEALKECRTPARYFYRSLYRLAKNEIVQNTDAEHKLFAKKNIIATISNS